MEHLAQWTDWLWSLVAVTGAAILGLGLHSVAFAILNQFSRRTASSLEDSLVCNAKGPLRAILPVLAILLTLPFVPLPSIVLDPLHHAVGLGLIAGRRVAGDQVDHRRRRCAYRPPCG